MIHLAHIFTAGTTLRHFGGRGGRGTGPKRK